MLKPTKWQVVSWTSSQCTLLGVYHRKEDAIAAAQAVSLTGGTIGAGLYAIVGSESLEVYVGVPTT